MIQLNLKGKFADFEIEAEKWRFYLFINEWFELKLNSLCKVSNSHTCCDWSNRSHRNMIDNRKALIKSQAAFAIKLPSNPIHSFQYKDIMFGWQLFCIQCNCWNVGCLQMPSTIDEQKPNYNRLITILFLTCTHSRFLFRFYQANYRHFHSFSVGVLIVVSRLVQRNWR